MRKKMAFILASCMLISGSTAFAKDPVSKKDAWEKVEFQSLVAQLFVDGNWEVIRDWASMDMHDVVLGTDDVTLTINENKISPAHKEMLGVQNEYQDNYNMFFADGKLKKGYLDACERMTETPTFRLGGTSSNYVNIANNIDEYNKRSASKLTYLPDEGGSDGGGTIRDTGAGTYRFGYGEALQMIYANNPDASIIPCVSILTTSPEDVKKVYHFLRDEADESDLGKMRKNLYGIEKPVDVAYWEIGNELDQHNEVGRLWHAKLARALMQSILEEDPNARCLVCGPSAPWQTGGPGNKEPKIEDWVAYITEYCGDVMWGMSWHPYYDGYGTNYMLWLSDTIKNIMDDVANEKGFTDKDGNIKDFKIVGTEGARFADPADHTFPGSANFESALSNAHYLNVMQQRDYYWGNMLHNYTTGTVTMWPYLYVDGAGDFFLSPTAKMYEVYNEAMGDVVLDSEWSMTDQNGEVRTFSDTCYEDWKFSAVAYASGVDDLTVLLLNKDNYREKDVTIDFVNDGYTLTGITTLSAPNMFTFSWDKASEDLTTITREEKNEPNQYHFHMKDGTIMVLHYKDTKKRNIASGGNSAGGDDVTGDDLSNIEDGFTDITYNWAKGEISKMKSLGFVSGKSDNLFCPTEYAKKSELATMLSRVLSLDTSYSGHIFSDIPDGAWYEKYANACYAKGIFTDSNFGAEEYINFREMLKILDRINSLYRIDNNFDTNQILNANGISCADETDAYLLANAVHNGYIYRLYENGNVQMNHKLTRDELTSIMYWLYKKIG